MEDRYSVTQYSVSQVLGLIGSGDIAIPEIQRPFVWDSTKVRDLVDSLYHGYPTGYLITWKNPDVKIKGGGLSQGKTVLIDGQQRVTAIMAALAGMQVLTDDYESRRIRIAFDPLYEGENTPFAVQTPVIAKDPRWIPDISVLFEPAFNAKSFIMDYIAANPEVDSAVVNARVDDLRAIANRQLGVFVVDERCSMDEVTDIFIRINSKGVALSQTDFALSKITAARMAAIADVVFGEDGVKAVQRIVGATKDAVEADVAVAVSADTRPIDAQSEGLSVSVDQKVEPLEVTEFVREELSSAGLASDVAAGLATSEQNNASVEFGSSYGDVSESQDAAKADDEVVALKDELIVAIKARGLKDMLTDLRGEYAGMLGELGGEGDLADRISVIVRKLDQCISVVALASSGEGALSASSASASQPIGTVSAEPEAVAERTDEVVEAAGEIQNASEQASPAQESLARSTQDMSSESQQSDKIDGDAAEAKEKLATAINNEDLALQVFNAALGNKGVLTLADSGDDDFWNALEGFRDSARVFGEAIEGGVSESALGRFAEMTGYFTNAAQAYDDLSHTIDCLGYSSRYLAEDLRDDLLTIFGIDFKDLLEDDPDTYEKVGVEASKIGKGFIKQVASSIKDPSVFDFVADRLEFTYSDLVESYASEINRNLIDAEGEYAIALIDRVIAQGKANLSPEDATEIDKRNVAALENIKDIVHDFTEYRNELEGQRDEKEGLELDNLNEEIEFYDNLIKILEMLENNPSMFGLPDIATQGAKGAATVLDAASGNSEALERSASGSAKPLESSQNRTMLQHG